VLVDIDAHVRLELVNHSLTRFEHHHAALEQRAARSLRRIDPSPVRSVATCGSASASTIGRRATRAARALPPARSI